MPNPSGQVVRGGLPLGGAVSRIAPEGTAGGSANDSSDAIRRLLVYIIKVIGVNIAADRALVGGPEIAHNSSLTPDIKVGRGDVTDPSLVVRSECRPGRSHNGDPVAEPRPSDGVSPPPRPVCA